VKTAEDVRRSVDLARVDLVEQSQQDENVEDERVVLRRRTQVLVVSSAVDVQKPVAFSHAIGKRNEGTKKYDVAVMSAILARILSWFLFFVRHFRPHRSTTYVDAAFCYRPSSVVCRSVCLSVCLYVCRSVCRYIALVNTAKTAAPIEMPFGLRTRVGSWNHVLDGVQIPPWIAAILRGKGASHCKVQGVV